MQAPEPKKRKMSRVEKELASLAPWAWDPLVGKHAPGSAMMRDFTEVVADKTVTTNTSSYRFSADTAAATATRTPGRPSDTTVLPGDNAETTTAFTAPGNGGGVGTGGVVLSYAEGTARKRVRSPPHSHSVFAPTTASKETPAGGGHARRATPPTEIGGPPPLTKGSQTPATANGSGGTAAVTSAKGAPGQRVGANSGGGVLGVAGPGGGDGDGVVGGGRTVAITPANLGKALEEAGGEVVSMTDADGDGAGAGAGEVGEDAAGRQSSRSVRGKQADKAAAEKAAGKEKNAKSKANNGGKKKTSVVARDDKGEGVSVAAAAAPDGVGNKENVKPATNGGGGGVGGGSSRSTRGTAAAAAAAAANGGGDQVKRTMSSVPRELSMLEPLAPADARRQREVRIMPLVTYKYFPPPAFISFLLPTSPFVSSLPRKDGLQNCEGE